MNVGTIVLHEIDKETAERYLGYGTSSADPVTAGLLRKCEAELLPEIQARYVYKIFDLTDGQPESICGAVQKPSFCVRPSLPLSTV